jgi:hypothetical protein
MLGSLKVVASLIVLAVAAGAAAYFYRSELWTLVKPDAAPRSRTQVVVKEIEGPLVMRTRGGLTCPSFSSQ